MRFVEISYIPDVLNAAEFEGSCGPCPLILGRPLHAIDYQKFAGTFGRLKLQAKLLLDCGEDRYAYRGVGGCGI
jgi:hypothetical protein